MNWMKPLAYSVGAQLVGLASNLPNEVLLEGCWSGYRRGLAWLESGLIGKGGWLWVRLLNRVGSGLVKWQGGLIRQLANGGLLGPVAS